MSNFVEITKDDFDTFMDALGFQQVEPNHRCHEAVYDAPYGDGGCFVRVYSTIATDDVGRGVGKDAIRVVAVSPGGDVFLKPNKRVHRTKNWRRNTLDRIERIHELNPAFEERPCTCGGTLRTRAGRHGAFLGCSNYPRCRITAQPTRRA